MIGDYKSMASGLFEVSKRRRWYDGQCAVMSMAEQSGKTKTRAQVSYLLCSPDRQLRRQLTLTGVD